MPESKTDEKDAAQDSATTAIVEKKDETPKKGTRQHTAWLVKQYAKKLINDRRAGQFATAIALMGKRDARIANATEESLLTAMMACVHLDLMPNTPEQLAFIIPYRGAGGTYQAQFQIGYKGMADLAYRTGQISSISAELVFPKDEFKVTLGTERGLHHVPDYEINRTDLSEATHVYATAQLVSGKNAFEVLSISEIKKIRDKVKAKSGDAPWAQWPEVMAKKTAVKRLLKLLPSSREDNRLQLGAMFDSWAEAGKLGFKDGEVIEAKKRATDAKQAEKVQKRIDEAKAARDTKSDEVKDGEEPKEENGSDDAGKATA